MKVKTGELIDADLDWATGVAEGYELSLYGVDPSIRARVPGQGVIAPWRPTYYWNQGGPIIEREKIETYWHTGLGMWAARHGNNLRYGATPLIAAMCCYVASKLGDEVDVPEELT